jgi:hypothetical protein
MKTDANLTWWKMEGKCIWSGNIKREKEVDLK